MSTSTKQARQQAVHCAAFRFYFNEVMKFVCLFVFFFAASHLESL